VRTQKGTENSTSHTSAFGQYKGTKVDPTTISDLCSKGFCFSCKEVWSKGHKCMTLRRIHLIELVQEDDKEIIKGDHEEAAK
jgi:hypothetical protein